MKQHHFLYFMGVLGMVIALGMAPVQAATSSSAQDMQSQSSSQDMQSQQSGSQPMQSQGSQMQQPASQSSQTSQNDAPIQISPVTLKKIQDQLDGKGYKVGPTDGIWGDSTASAVKEFQQTQGLAPSGNLNIETLQALNIDLSAIEAGDQSGVGGKNAASSGAQLFISPAELKNIQQSLSDQGFDVGQADGVWGKKTQQAISKFQQEKGMQPTGNINIAMLDQLGMSQVVAALGIGQAAGEAGGQQMAQAQQQQGASSGQQQEARGYFGDQAQEEQQQMQGTGDAIYAGAPLFAGSDMIQQVQQALQDAGQDPGQIDGTWGSQTQNALKQYQQNNDLVPTGSLTLQTIQKLLGSNYTPGSGDQQQQMQQQQPMDQQQQQPMDQQQQQPMGQQPEQGGQSDQQQMGGGVSGDTGQTQNQ